jgi:hypothetical protein
MVDRRLCKGENALHKWGTNACQRLCLLFWNTLRNAGKWPYKFQKNLRATSIKTTS